MREAEEQLVWQTFWITRVEHWDHYRDLLAVHLDAQRWEKVANAVGTLRRIQAEIEADPASKDVPCLPVTDPTRARMKSGRTQACLAYNALAKLAHGQAVQELGAPLHARVVDDDVASATPGLLR